MALSFTNMCGNDCMGCEGLQVCQSAAGYYLGKLDEYGAPSCRASEQYYGTQEQAQAWLDVFERCREDARAPEAPAGPPRGRWERFKAWWRGVD